MECVTHIQMLVTARRWKVFGLAEDGGRTDFCNIPGDHCLKESLSIGTTLYPSQCSLDNTFKLQKTDSSGIRESIEAYLIYDMGLPQQRTDNGTLSHIHSW